MPKPRKRKQANAFEKALGIGGTTPAYAQDMFTNAAARMGFGTPSLGQGATYELIRISYDYWQLITLFRNHWISRRIVEVPAQDMVKAWPRLTSDLEPKDLTLIDRALRKTNTKNNVLTGLTWGRLFGGAGGLMAIDGQENELDEPLDLESIGIGAYKGIIPFDRWAGISPIGDVCTDINRPLDFNKPEMYEVRINGGDSFKVHSSRLLRFLGPTVPTPELEAQSYWGISVLEPAYESITMLDNMGWNLLSLTFRANLLGMKFPELSQLLSGLGSSQVASQKFEQRMSAINHLMSNNSLIPLPADGSIESTQFSFSGMGEIFQLFQLNLAGAAQMPVTRLFGRTYNGLGQAGDGDEKIYEEKISTDQTTYMLPQMEKLYPVILMSTLGEVPDDLDLVCPSIRVLDEKDKAELAKAVADTTTVYLNGGIYSPRRVAMEIKQSSDITGIGTNLDDEYIQKLSDDVQSEGELGEGLFGEGEPGLNASESPTKVAKEENKEGEEKAAKGGKGEEKAAKGGKELKKKAGKADDHAPAMDALPDGLHIGESLVVGNQLLTVASIGDAVEDLDGELAVPVRFTDGSVVAYALAEELPRHDWPRPTARAADVDFNKATLEQLTNYYVAQKMRPDKALIKSQAVIQKRELVERLILEEGLTRPKAQAKAYQMEKAKDVDEECPNCEGAGKFGEQQCGWCKGTGKTSKSVREAIEKVLGKPSKTWDARHGTRKLRKARDNDGPSSVTLRSQELMDYHALPVRVESRQGDKRTGMTPEGLYWSVTMPADYGFIEYVNGADGDSLDCYVGLSPESSNVYVVDQYDLQGKKFDEHKCMLGYHTQESAQDDYMLGHHLSHKTFAAITAFTMPMFRKWLRTHDMTKPCSSEVTQAGDAAEFKEALHPRKADGKFGKGQSASVAMPKGMEHITKGAHKTATSFAEELLASKKHTDKEIAQACNSTFGTNFSQSNINFVKNKMWLATPEGKAATAAKKAGIAANSANIAKASAAPMEQKKLDAVLTEAEKATYKTMYVSAKDAAGKATYFKVSGVPDGLDNQASMVTAMKKKGLTVVNSGPFSASKPAPSTGYTDYTLPDQDVKELKATAYEKAQQTAKANKVVSESEELSDDIQTSIKHYTNGSYTLLNRALRSGQPMTTAQATLAANLDTAIRKSKIAEDTTVYRGVREPAKFFGSSVSIGTVIVDNGFISTSKNSSTANVFGGTGLVAKIKLPKGSSAMDVSPLSLHSAEKEVLLPRGSMFRILGVDGKTVEIEYVSG